MAKTVRDAKQPKAAAAKATRKSTAPKPKPSPKNEPKATASRPSQPVTTSSGARSRKRDNPNANPFDLPPDAGQSSIMKFAKGAKHEHEQPPGLTTATAPITITAPSMGMVDGGVASGSGIDVDPDDQNIDTSIAPSAPNIQSLDQVVETAFNHWKSRPSNWMSDLDAMCRAFDNLTFMSLIGQCREHPLFSDHCKSIRESAQLDENEWTFGDQDTGEPMEDLVEMIRWLVLRHAGHHVNDIETEDIGEVPNAVVSPSTLDDQRVQNQVNLFTTLKVTHTAQSLKMAFTALKEIVNSLQESDDTMAMTKQLETMVQHVECEENHMKLKHLFTQLVNMQIMVGKVTSQDNTIYVESIVSVLKTNLLECCKVVNNVASLESNDDDAIIAPSNDEDDAGSHIKDGAAEAIPVCAPAEIDTTDIPGSYAQAMMMRAVKVDGTLLRIANLPSSWTVATTCSGCGTFEIALNSVANAISAHTPVDNLSDIEVKEAFACESEKFKQNLLINQVLSGTDACVFADVTLIHDDSQRQCVRHGRACAMPSASSVFVLASGFSCKSLSKLHNEAGSFKKALAEQNQESSTFRTFAGTMRSIEITDPLWILLENVDMGDGSEADSNCAVVARLLNDAGFENRMILLTATDFGLPQRRTRLFVLGVNIKRAAAELVNSPEKILERALTVYLPLFKTDPPPVDAFLDDDDGTFVEEELARRQKVRQDRESRTPASENFEAELDNSLRGGKWKDAHMQLAAARGIPWPIAVPTSLLKNAWYKTLPPREQEVLGFVAQKNDERARLGQPIFRFADLYQSAGRTPTSTSDVVPTVLPGGTVWDMRRSRLLIGVEQLALQGINFENQDQLSNNQWQDVAGNAFPSTVIVALQIAMLCSLEYISYAEDRTIDSVQSILKALA